MQVPRKVYNINEFAFRMTLYLIGLGLSDEKDISVKGLEIVKKCDIIYMENYTGFMMADVSDFENFYGKKVIIAERSLVEQGEEIVDNSISKEVALLVMGDPLFATTHIDIIMRARKKNVKIIIIHNASILNAVGESGLQLYKFGKITSVPFPEKSFQPVTAFEVMKQNKILGLHSLLLLDLRPKENKHMTIRQAIDIMLDIAKKRHDTIFTEDTLCIGCARLGSENSLIKAGKASRIMLEDFGIAPHCLLVPGELHFVEEEMMEMHMLK